jgi:hypothetical protein
VVDRDEGGDAVLEQGVDLQGRRQRTDCQQARGDLQGRSST